jgi:Putative exonuclease, RdgC
MGLLANTVSLSQFHVVGEPPAADLATWVGEALAAQGFVPIDQGPEELSVGWVEIDDSKSSAFAAPQSYQRDHYLCFALRRDQRRVPARLLRAHFEQAQADYLAANPGLQRIGKQKKEELREAVRGQLLARTLPEPAMFDAVWDTERGLLSLASLSAKVIELFENQFKQSFPGLRLVALHPYARAEQVLPAEQRPALAQANQAGSGTVLDLIKDNQWLGRDFFLWLTYQTMNAASTYRVNQTTGPALSGEGFVAYLNDRLTLVGGSEQGVQKVTVAGPQDHFSEVRTALRSGKQITEAVLYLEQQENLWKLNLKGESFHFAGFKAPAVKLERDNRAEAEHEQVAIFYERMHVLEGGLQLFDSLFADFLALRLSPDWAGTLATINGWLEAGEDRP